MAGFNTSAMFGGAPQKAATNAGISSAAQNGFSWTPQKSVTPAPTGNSAASELASARVGAAGGPSLWDVKPPGIDHGINAIIEGAPAMVANAVTSAVAPGVTEETIAGPAHVAEAGMGWNVEHIVSRGMEFAAGIRALGKMEAAGGMGAATTVATNDMGRDGVHVGNEHGAQLAAPIIKMDPALQRQQQQQAALSA